MATEAGVVTETDVALDDDDRPTLPAIISPLSFGTTAEAFFLDAPERSPALAWPVDEEAELREYWAARRRRQYGAWVALLVAGSLTLLAAAWLPLIGG